MATSEEDARRALNEEKIKGSPTAEEKERGRGKIMDAARQAEEDKKGGNDNK